MPNTGAILDNGREVFLLCRACLSWEEKMNPDAVSQSIGDDDDYSIAWLSRRIQHLNREILQRVAERDKLQAMLDRKFGRHKAQEKGSERISH